MRSFISPISSIDTGKGLFLLFFCAIYILNPILGIVLCLFYILGQSQRGTPTYIYITFFAFLACWLGCANMTKFPTGDLPGYIHQFNLVPELGFYRTIFEAWGGTGKEPLYSFFTYIGYYLCLGKASIYFGMLVFIMYFLLFISTYKLFQRINASKFELLCGIFSLAFFTQYFVLTSHLIRQMLAMSVVIYAIVDRVVYGRYNWICLIGSILIHTSSLLLVLLSFLPWVYQRLSVSRAIILSICFIPFIIFNVQIGYILGGHNLPIETIQYAIERYGSNEGDGLNNGLNISTSLILMVFIPLLIVICRLMWILRKEKKHPIYPIVTLCLILMLFVLLFSQNPLIQYRFFYYSYTFIPLLLPLMFYRSNQNYDKIYCFVVSFFFISRFFLIHNTSGMQFAPMSVLCTMPIPYYFLSSFYY